MRSRSMIQDVSGHVNDEFAGEWIRKRRWNKLRVARKGKVYTLIITLLVKHR